MITSGVVVVIVAAMIAATIIIGKINSFNGESQTSQMKAIQ